MVFVLCSKFAIFLAPFMFGILRRIINSPCGCFMVLKTNNNLPFNLPIGKFLHMIHLDIRLEDKYFKANSYFYCFALPRLALSIKDLTSLLLNLETGPRFANIWFKLTSGPSTDGLLNCRMDFLSNLKR